MPKVYVTDVILRDAHQSLIATRMRTQYMLPACARLDRVGYWSLEVWGGATYDACLRFLKEDPWERLRQLRAALPNTRLQMLLRGQNLLGYRHYADDVVQAFITRAAALGIDVFRIFDALNDTRNLRASIAAVKALGKHAQGTICYTTSPVHGIPQFIAMAKELEDQGCDSIAIKDMAGLLTPWITARLVGELTAVVRVPVHVHSHACAGLADMCQLKAIESGCLHIDTSISAFAGGASHPATESMVAALRGTEYDTGLDLPLLQELADYFRSLRKKYHAFESEFTGLDTRVQVNQVPGGMISNLHSQLREQGALQRMNDVLEEIPRVRADLGYPPLVTPTSQIVGAQAVFNILTETRYKTITNEVKAYVQGRYGKSPGPIDPDLQTQAIGQEDIIDCRPADLLVPEMDNLRAEIQEIAQSEEDVLIYAMFPELGRDFLRHRADGTLHPESLELAHEDRGQGQTAPVMFNVTLHGETYHIRVTGSGHKAQGKRPFYVSVDGVPEEIQVETLESVVPGNAVTTTQDVKSPAAGSSLPRATAPGHVTASMPGVIVAILVKVGDTVNAGDPVAVSEAMKMEAEIQAPIAGRVIAVHAAKGDSVNPDDVLLEIG